MTPAPFAEPLSYYLNAVTSEYRQSTNMLAWLTANLQLFQDVTACLAQIQSAFYLPNAVGVQLDTIGNLLGQPRVLAFQPTGILILSFTSGGSGYVVGDIVTIVQSGAQAGSARVTLVSGGGVVTGLTVVYPGTGYHIANALSTTGGTGTGLMVNIKGLLSPILDDATYRTLLYCVVIRDHWNGQIDSLQAAWANIFSGGTIAIDDGQDMTARIFVAGSFPSIILDLILNGLIVPRPQGVKYTYSIADLPMLGFDQDTAFIAGFDLGKFV